MLSQSGSSVRLKKFVVWNLCISVSLLVSVLGCGVFRYLAEETLEENYWMVVLGLVALTGPSISYLISTSRSNETK